MFDLDILLWLAIFGTGGLMGVALLRGVVTAAGVEAQQIIDQRRQEAEIRKASHEAAQAAGRAAALEPLNLNPDGTIEEPIIGVVEQPG